MYYLGAVISGFIFITWIIVLYYITTIKDPILLTGMPIISIGILVIPLEGSYILITRLTRIRKVYSPTLKIDKITNRDILSSEAGTLCFPWGDWYKNPWVTNI